MEAWMAAIIPSVVAVVVAVSNAIRDVKTRRIAKEEVVEAARVDQEHRHRIESERMRHEMKMTREESARRRVEASHTAARKILKSLQAHLEKPAQPGNEKEEWLRKCSHVLGELIPHVPPGSHDTVEAAWDTFSGGVKTMVHVDRGEYEVIRSFINAIAVVVSKIVYEAHEP